jgi:hypothetical protein
VAGVRSSYNSPLCRWLAVARGPFAGGRSGLETEDLVAQGHGLSAVPAAGETLCASANCQRGLCEVSRESVVR